MKFIDTADIPNMGGGRRGNWRWPYVAWEQGIPAGKALEITDELNGTTPVHAAQIIRHFIVGHPDLGLSFRSVQRGERLWIVKPDA